MFESFIGTVAAVIITIADVGLEYASSVSATEEVRRALNRAACRRLV